MAPYRLYVDTQEGEKCYSNVEIGDAEMLGDVLAALIAELHESGFTVAGSSAGDLRVIWNGIELDLERTLPEQGPRPNDSLRILAETYEGGGINLRKARVESDLRLLSDLESLNPGILHLDSIERRALEERIQVTISETPGVAQLNSSGPVIRNRHRFCFVFPRFYPEMAIACYTLDPLFHPNVNTRSGFFCLWEEVLPTDSLIQAICRAQAATAYRIANLSQNHCLNQDAAKWCRDQARTQRLVPFRYKEIVTFKIRNGNLEWLEPPRRIIKRVPKDQAQGDRIAKY